MLNLILYLDSLPINAVYRILLIPLKIIYNYLLRIDL